MEELKQTHAINLVNEAIACVQKSKLDVFMVIRNKAENLTTHYVSDPALNPQTLFSLKTNR